MKFYNTRTGEQKIKELATNCNTCTTLHKQRIHNNKSIGLISLVVMLLLIAVGGCSNQDPKPAKVVDRYTAVRIKAIGDSLRSAKMESAIVDTILVEITKEAEMKDIDMIDISAIIQQFNKKPATGKSPGKVKVDVKTETNAVPTTDPTTVDVEPVPPTPDEETVVEPVVDKPVAPGTEPPKPISPKANEILYPDGSKYTGTLKNGKPNGGRLDYATRQVISKKDSKRTMAEAGDYIKGAWHNGEVHSVTLYSAKGEKKGKLNIPVNLIEDPRVNFDLQND